MNYKEIIWSYHKPKITKPNILYLTKKDINHLVRVYKKYKIAPESLDKVTILFLSDRNELIRYIIKELDILLKVGGEYLIKSTSTDDHAKFIRSKSQISYEFSVSTNGRYRNTELKSDSLSVEMVYEKIQNVLSENDTINRWSFGIITDGRKNARVTEIIESIVSQGIPECEILICGNYDKQCTYGKEVVVIEDVITRDIRAPICAKKNRIAEIAKYNNLVIVHDRYTFPKDWFQKMVNYGNYFELLSMPNVGANNGRVSDWNTFSAFPSGTLRGDFLLPKYSQWTNWWYAQGGILIVKNLLYSSSPLDNRLHWGDLEDVQFSQIGNLKGWFYYFDVNNRIYTESSRLPESSFSNSKIFFAIKFIRAFIKSSSQITKNIIQHYRNTHL